MLRDSAVFYMPYCRMPAIWHDACPIHFVGSTRPRRFGIDYSLTRKEDTKSESIIARVRMCCPQGGEAITRGIMSSRNLRQTIIRRRKHEPKPRQAIPRRRKCERNLRHFILRCRKCKRNLRHTILRWRKCKRNLRHFILRGRKCEPKPGHVIIRGWMRQTESRAGRHPAEDGTTDFRASLYGGEREQFILSTF